MASTIWAVATWFRLLRKCHSFAVDNLLWKNLYALSDVEGMALPASIANELINVPDGTQSKSK